METNELMENEQVTEVSAEVVKAAPKKSFKTIGKVGMVVAGGVAVCLLCRKFIIKPKNAKVKADGEENIIDVDDFDVQMDEELEEETEE